MKFVLALLISIGACAVQAKLSPLTMGRPYRAKRIQSIQEYQTFLNEGLKDAGFDVTVKETLGQTPYDLLIKGQLDALSYDDHSLKYSREQTISVSFPIIKTHARVFHLKKHPMTLADLPKLKGCLSLNNSILQEEARRRKLKVISTANPLQSVQMVLEGKADYFLGIEEVGQGAIAATPGAQNDLVMSEEVFSDVPLYLTLHKSFKKDIPRIEDAFRKKLKGDLSAFPLISKNLNKSP